MGSMSGRDSLIETATDMMQSQPHEMFISFFKTTANVAGQATRDAMGAVQNQVNPIPIVPLQDQETIKMLLKKIDELLTKECILCGELLLDILNTSDIAEFEQTEES